MKFVKITLISTGILALVLLTGAVIFVSTFDVNRFKPRIIEEAGKLLHRGVNFDKAWLTLSFAQGVSLKVSNLSIADDPLFAKGAFLTVNDISLAVDVPAYLFQKKIRIPEVFIDSARVTIRREKNGSLNVQSIAAPAQPPAQGADLAPDPAPVPVPPLLVDSLKGSRSTLIYIDRSFEPPLNLVVSDLSFSLSGISLTEPFAFSVEASFLSEKKNIALAGKARMDLAAGEIIISELKALSDISDIALKNIPAVFPMIKDAVLPESLKGNAQVMVKKMAAGAKGLVLLDADAALTGGVIQLKELASPIKAIDVRARITQKDIVFDKVSAVIGEGQITGSGFLDEYMSKQLYGFEADGRTIRLQDLVISDDLPFKVEGIVSAKIKLKGAGCNPQAVKSTLTGDADIAVTGAKLKGVNVLRKVLDRISVIPGLSEKVEAGLPDRFKQDLKSKDTDLSDIKLPITIENGSFLAQDASFGTDAFMFKGSGQASFDGAYSLEGSFFITKELSLSMAESVSELQYLLNENKEISFPLKVSGKAAQKPKLSVDTNYIAGQLVETQAKQQIFKAIDKYLGPKETAPGATEQPAGGGQEATSQKDAVKEAVGNLLDKILKK